MTDGRGTLTERGRGAPREENASMERIRELAGASMQRIREAGGASAQHIREAADASAQRIREAADASTQRIREAVEPQRHEYRVTSMWCGWWGGWGSEDGIAKHIERETTERWHLASTKVSLRLWLWVVPRPKMLFIYSRSA